MKGPWTAEFTDTPYEEIGESWVVDGPDGSICTIDCPLDERESVAHLIAAAPELYAACAAMIEWDEAEKNARPYDEDGGRAFHDRMTLCERAFDLARKAIAKARGEQS